MRTRGRSVDLRLLGPVGLGIGGIWHSVGGPRAQAVLALLAVRAGEIVTADSLIEQLWAGQPPRAARVALQSYVSRLRGFAGPDTDRMLPRHPRGYFLDISVVEIDAARFVDLSEHGRRDAAGGRWREALTSLRNARALWHGVPFTGIDEVPTLVAERSRLEELSVETRLSEMAAELEILGPSDVISSLRHLVAAHPWDERGWRLLMLALYRAGRQTEALEAAGRARHLLTEEQGLDPSWELAELEHKILVHHPALEPPAPPPIKLRNALSATPYPLIGRDRELGDLLAEWDRVSHTRRAGLVLVGGEPGVGKSHLVAELAGKVEARGGAVWVGRCLDEPRLPLQPWSDLIPYGVSGEPDSTFQPGATESLIALSATGAHRLFSAITEQFRQVLQLGASLVVVEDLHWADVAALRLLDHLLACCAGLPLLMVATMRSTAAGMTVTTRGVLGELSARIQPHTVDLDGLDPGDLRAMLTDRGFHLSAGEATSVWERTGGVPLLAVEAIRGGHGVVDARLSEVGDTAAALAELMAVAGDTTSFALLSAATGLNEETLAAALDELVEAGVLRASPGDWIAFEFTRPLYREAIAGRLSGLRRLLLFRRLTAALNIVPDSASPPALTQ